MARTTEKRINIGLHPKIHEKAKIIKKESKISINTQINMGLYLLYAYLTKAKKEGKDPYAELNRLKRKYWEYIGKIDVKALMEQSGDKNGN